MGEPSVEGFQQRGSVAPTSSVENTGLFIRERKLLFASDWHFKEKGVAEVRAQLSKDLDQYNVPVALFWHADDSVFVITCLPGETDLVSATFLRVLQGIVSKECEVDSDDSNDDSSTCSAGEDIQPVITTPSSLVSQLTLLLITSDKISLFTERLQAEGGCETMNIESLALQSGLASDSQDLLRERIVRTSHFFHSEEQGDFQVILKYIIDVGKRYFETTLLDYLCSPVADVYHGLHRAIIARCASYDHMKNTYIPVKESKYKRATKELDNDAIYRDWKDFTYSGYGECLTPQQQEQVQPLVLQHQHHASGQTASAVMISAADVERPRLREGVPSGLSLLDGDSSVLGIPSLLGAPMVPAAGQIDDTDPLISFCDQPTSIAESRPANRTEEILDVPSAVQKSRREVSDVSAGIIANRKPQKPCISSTSDQEKTKKGMSLGFADRLPLPSPIPQKPLPGGQLSSHIKATLLQLVPEFTDMLEASQTFRGRVKVHAYFGRILLKDQPPHLIAAKQSDKSLRRDWLRDLLDSTPANSSFTKVLTTSAQDIHFLLDLKNIDGERMWDLKPYDWGVQYRFQYCSRLTGASFTIEADGETLKHTVHTHHNLGRIFVHGLKGHWDLQVAIDGYTDDTEKYDDLVDTIKRTLFIPRGMNSPTLFFGLSEAIDRKYQLDALRVRRVTKFRKVNYSPCLIISEFQDLDVFSRREPDSSFRFYRATQNKQTRSPLQKLDLWYEASTSCQEIERKLEELDTEKKVNRMPDKLLQLNDAETILKPALEMLKLIDGIGSWNHNDVVIRRPVSPAPLPPTEDLDTVW